MVELGRVVMIQGGGDPTPEVPIASTVTEIQMTEDSIGAGSLKQFPEYGGEFICRFRLIFE